MTTCAFPSELRQYVMPKITFPCSDERTSLSFIFLSLTDLYSDFFFSRSWSSFFSLCFSFRVFFTSFVPTRSLIGRSDILAAAIEFRPAAIAPAPSSCDDGISKLSHDWTIVIRIVFYDQSKQSRSKIVSECHNNMGCV